MKAPNKIYVCIPDDDIVGTASTQKGFPHQFVTEEYTRTDTFIKNAEEWLRKNQKGFILTDKDITDFVNYMKGE